mgnify:CR=1 FL=1|jgi:hypothetical protein
MYPRFFIVFYAYAKTICETFKAKPTQGRIVPFYHSMTGNPSYFQLPNPAQR